MTRVATEKNEDYLLDIARHGTAAHVERLVRNYRKVKRNEALELDNERHAVRELGWYFDDDGCLVLKGRFTPDKHVRGNVFALTTKNGQSGLRITPETGECRWGGEQMDDDLAILCMFQLE